MARKLNFDYTFSILKENGKVKMEMEAQDHSANEACPFLLTSHPRPFPFGIKISAVKVCFVFEAPFSAELVM